MTFVRIILLHYFCFLSSRYEVESEENRRAIVIETGRRYLGIEEEIKEHDEDDEKTELNNLSQNNVSSPRHIQINEKSEGQSFCEGDLVIDILNDELISLVKQKIHGRLAEHKNIILTTVGRKML